MVQKTRKIPNPPSYTNGCPLERLPSKIKLRIMCKLRSEHTLRNLISAYPLFKRVKVDNEKQVTTALACNHFRDLGCNPFQRHDVVEIKLPEGEKFDKAFLTAFHTFYDACRDHQYHTKYRGSTSPHILPIELCKQMLKVVHVSGWLVAEDYVARPTDRSLSVLPIKYFLEAGDPNIKYDQNDRPRGVRKLLIGKLDYRRHIAGVDLIFMTQLVRKNSDLRAAVREKMRDAADQARHDDKKREDWKRKTGHKESRDRR